MLTLLEGTPHKKIMGALSQLLGFKMFKLVPLWAP